MKDEQLPNMNDFKDILQRMHNQMVNIDKKLDRDLQKVTEDNKNEFQNISQQIQGFYFYFINTVFFFFVCEKGV